MKYNLQEEGDKLILKVELSPYISGGNRRRETFNSDNALKIINENSYKGYTLIEGSSNLDNKFNPIQGTYVFLKQSHNQEKLKNNLDTKEPSVLKSSKRRRRKNAINTDEE